MVTLHGIAWDNDRAVKPLEGTLPAWGATQPDITVQWSKRPLSTFAHQTISDLTPDYDLIILDHPHIGEAAEAGLIMPVDEIIDSPELIEHHRATVGPTFESYRWNGRSWAFPIDAACQVAVRRPDLMPESECGPSPSWPELLNWSQQNPGRLGLPFYPVLSLMCLFSICASLAEGPCREPDLFVSRRVGLAAVDILMELARQSHPDVLGLNDIKTLDLMSESDELSYIPLVFLYSNYGRDGYRSHPLRFEDIPHSGGPPVGAILGGAGLAVSSTCANPKQAGLYAQWLMSPDIQKGLYVEHFGQPASLAAWKDPGADRLVGGAFAGTSATMDLAYLRPTYPGFVQFQEHCGPIVREAILDMSSPDMLLDKLDREHRKARQDWERDSGGGS